MSFPAIAQSAMNEIAQLGNVPPHLQSSLLLANLMPRLWAPMLRRMATGTKEVKVLTHSALTTTAGAAANETATVNINVPNSFDFLCSAFNCINGVDGTTAHQFEVQVYFQGSDRRLVHGRTAGIHAEAFTNASNRLWVWPAGQIFARNSSIQVVFTTVGTIATANLNCYFFGVAQYDQNLLDATRQMVG